MRRSSSRRGGGDGGDGDRHTDEREVDGAGDADGAGGAGDGLHSLQDQQQQIPPLLFSSLPLLSCSFSTFCCYRPIRTHAGPEVTSAMQIAPAAGLSSPPPACSHSPPCHPSSLREMTVTAGRAPWG